MFKTKCMLWIIRNRNELYVVVVATVSSYWFSLLTSEIIFLDKIHINILMESIHCLCTWRLVIHIDIDMPLF